MTCWNVGFDESAFVDCARWTFQAGAFAAVYCGNPSCLPLESVHGDWQPAGLFGPAGCTSRAPYSEDATPECALELRGQLPAPGL